MKKTLIALVLAATVTHAQAEFIGGDVLLANLQSTDAANSAAARGYVIGVFDAVSTTLCLPAKLTPATVIELITKQLELSKDINKNYSGATIVHYTLKKQYECNL
jgi:hypothetical protein